MREFHSYGPVNSKEHFCLERRKLVECCLQQLTGKADQYGHYFTIWAARQTGKTWLIRQMEEEIPQCFPEQFEVFRFSLGGLRGMEIDYEGDPEKDILPTAFWRVIQDFPGEPEIKNWGGFRNLFSREGGIWKKPLVLLIDEVDTVPSEFLDLLINQFRELYLERKTNWLHGLALVGVRAVLGVDSRKGSPFNIQKSLNMSNLTSEEVRELYQQYQEESGQKIDPNVIEQIFSITQGQPGLVSWLGELLTAKYNFAPDQPIGLKQWKFILPRAKFVEPNNTLMNLIAKARDPEYQDLLFQLFGSAEVLFSFHKPMHNFLYMHGILAPHWTQDSKGEEIAVCRYTSPFIQECLFHALGDELVLEQQNVAALGPMDDLSDVFDEPQLGLPALIRRYREYLQQLEKRGINPWQNQPRRVDLKYTEAVGHFHLYAWLKDAVGQECSIAPEFPTGNGLVDLHIRFEEKVGIIEVKSFRNLRQVKRAKIQACRYAKSLKLDSVMVVLFSPKFSNKVLQELSGEEQIEGVRVYLEVIGMLR